MWLIISALAALAVTAAWFVAPRFYRFDILSLALWGLTTCIFVDHVLGYEDGAFFDISADSLVLSIAMLIPIFAVWEAYLIIQKLKTGAVSTVDKINVNSEVD